jgi:hypothetical protein
VSSAEIISELGPKQAMKQQSTHQERRLIMKVRSVGAVLFCATLVAAIAGGGDGQDPRQVKKQKTAGASD